MNGFVVDLCASVRRHGCVGGRVRQNRAGGSGCQYGYRHALGDYGFVSAGGAGLRGQAGANRFRSRQQKSHELHFVKRLGRSIVMAFLLCRVKVWECLPGGTRG
ncbi:hypothetical protein D3C71_1843930 [compost metagenome]